MDIKENFKQAQRKKYYKPAKTLALSGAAILFFYIYSTLNPYEYNFFPKCPFHLITGYKCPGCGSQRAIHYLFNFDIASAFHENQLLVVSIPYIILGLYLDAIKIKNEKQLRIRRVFYGKTAILIVFTIIISFWIFRNLL